MTMPTARKPNSFGKIVLQPGGTTMEEAITAADANLAGLKAAVVQELNDTVARMQAIGAAMQGIFDEPRMDDIYTLANTVIGMAGVFGTESLGKVSYSLCDLIDRNRRNARSDDLGIRLHIDTLRLISNGAVAGIDQQEAMVVSLRKIVERQ